MKLGKERRKYLAENFAKTAEYVFSIIILGQVVASKFTLYYSGLAVVVYLSLLVIGTFILPEDKKGLERKND